MKYYITDWADNVLDYTNVFKPRHLASEKEFDSFEDAEAYLIELLTDEPENAFDDYCIEELNK